jgi:hypothetical protein
MDAGIKRVLMEVFKHINLAEGSFHRASVLLDEVIKGIEAQPDLSKVKLDDKPIIAVAPTSEYKEALARTSALFKDAIALGINRNDLINISSEFCGIKASLKDASLEQLLKYEKLLTREIKTAEKKKGRRQEEEEVEEDVRVDIPEDSSSMTRAQLIEAVTSIFKAANDKAAVLSKAKKLGVTNIALASVEQLKALLEELK